jgi:hypothetical protein
MRTESRPVSRVVRRHEWRLQIRKSAGRNDPLARKDNDHGRDHLVPSTRAIPAMPVPLEVIQTTVGIVFVAMLALVGEIMIRQP